MSLLQSIPNWRGILILLGQFPFFDHIGSPHKFYPQVIAHLSRVLDFIVNDETLPLQVALIAIHNDVLVPSVEVMSELLCNRLYSSLHICLLCVDIKETIVLLCEFSHGHHSLGE